MCDSLSAIALYVMTYLHQFADLLYISDNLHMVCVCVCGAVVESLAQGLRS